MICIILQLIHTNTFVKVDYNTFFLICNRQNNQNFIFFWKSEKKDEFLIFVCIMPVLFQTEEK